ncbi:MAG: site-2 protease family protein [Helicobacteraceae bacterium]|jgi:Zn-dependent protease|nr:site-2 protease family protein [Helicobacteraceae bacterium]
MDWQRIIYSVPGVLIGFTIHEYFHAFAAYKLGDNTAKDQGRLTLDPIKHIDPIGMIFIIIAGFGWAKPVQFDQNMLRNPKRDKAIIAAAGPISNLILGILFIFIVKGLWLIAVSGKNEAIYNILDYITDVLFYCAYTNFGLFVFNIIPIPPLDGSHIFLSGINLSSEAENKIMKIGTPILYIILIIQSRTDYTILPISNIVEKIISIFF